MSLKLQASDVFPSGTLVTWYTVNCSDRRKHCLRDELLCRYPIYGRRLQVSVTEMQALLSDALSRRPYDRYASALTAALILRCWPCNLRFKATSVSYLLMSDHLTILHSYFYPAYFSRRNNRQSSTGTVHELINGYAGLNSGFSAGIIYCSHVTSNLLIRDMRVNPSCIRALPLDTELVIEGIRVTLIDANHCPGAVLLLFKTPPPKGSCFSHEVSHLLPAQAWAHPSGFVTHDFCSAAVCTTIPCHDIALRRRALQDW